MVNIDIEKIEYIKEVFEKTGLAISDKSAEKFFQYYKLLVSANENINLTAITDFKDVVLKHFVDSSILFSKNVSRETFFGASEKKKGEPIKIIDVGTGAGFPGIPLKIVLDDIIESHQMGIKTEFTLLDSLGKRVNFLTDTIDELSLKKIEAIHCRAEDAARDEAYREQFDICASRAVADLSVLAEYCLPFVKKGGFFISYKAEGCEAEVDNAKKAISEIGGTISDVLSINLPEQNIVRKLIIIEKTATTPDKYPRKAGIPSKKPIK